MQAVYGDSCLWRENPEIQENWEVTEDLSTRLVRGVLVLVYERLRSPTTHREKARVGT